MSQNPPSYADNMKMLHRKHAQSGFFSPVKLLNAQEQWIDLAILD